MILKGISLSNFRNFENREFYFNPFLTIILGENAKGKTNLLEAIYAIMNGSGFRESREEELILFGKDQSIVNAVFGIKDEKLNFKIALTKKTGKVEKSFFFNKAKKSYYQYLSELAKGVLFSPEQLDLVSGAPNLRRKYLNKIICFYDLDYKKKILNYESALRKRNKVLESYQGIGDLQEELSFWNQYLEKQASYITEKREEYLDFLNKHGKIDNKYFSVYYLKNEFNSKRLKEKINLEKRIRKTIIGPQRDDFKIMLKKNDSERNIHLFGSRSEQRLAIFWLKVNEVKFYEDYIKKRALLTARPIILLDDVFSELDVKNKKVIFNFIKKYQTIITSTDVKILDLVEMPKSVIVL